MARTAPLIVASLLVFAASTAFAQKGPGRRARAERSKSLEVGQQAPPLEGTTPFGPRFSSEGVVGPAGEHAAMVVVFTRLTDDGGERVLNETRKLDVEWSSLKVTVVLIGVGDRPSAVKERALEAAAGWPIIADPKKRIARRYRAEALPMAVLIDRSGVVREVFRGEPGELHASMRRALGSLLSVEMPWGESGRRSTLLSFDAKYRFGRPPSDVGASTRWQPLAKYIGEVANVFIAMVSARSYEELESMLRAGELELVNVGPATGAKIVDRYEPVVRFERGEGRTYRGIFFARHDRGIRSLAELRGKTLALVSERSTSGGLYPAAALLKAGLRLEDDVRLLWVKTHRKVAEAVRDGKADAGACYDDCRDQVWRSEEARDAATVEIAETVEIPGEIVFIRRDLPEDKKKRLRAALLSLGAHETVIRQLSRNEAPIRAVAPARLEALEKVRRELDGVAEAIEEAKRKAAAREASER